MKRISSLFLLGFLLTGALSAQQMNWSKIDPLLEQQLRENTGSHIKVTIYFEEQVDLPALVATFGRDTEIHTRRVQVVSALKQQAAESQAHVLPYLQAHQGVLQGTIRAHWISNDIRARMNRQAIADLSWREDVGMLVYEPPARLDDADAAHHAPYFMAPETAGGREPGLDVINAPALWAMGYTGIGKKVLIIDSGVSLTHPALTRNYYGNIVGDNLAWYNPGGPKAPFDCDEHGTHVTGVTVGMQLSNRDTFGVAINSMWMGSPAVDGGTVGGTCLFDVDDLDALQWALDPDGNTGTTDDMPDVINGSYGLEPQFFNVGMCTASLFRQRMEALEAASITFVQSAGNYGPGDSTMGAYKNVSISEVNSFTVGAVNGGNALLPIMGYSSRGPSRCGNTGALRIKPEISAPGHNVRSSVPGGGFKLLPGTSFSAPHVAGAALILHEAFPMATSVDVKEALYYSAVDYGPVGEDNAYGNGVIDLLAAYNYLVADGFTPAPVSRDKDAVLADVTLESVACGTSIAPEIILENNGNTPLSSAVIDYSYSDGTTGSFNWSGSLAPGATTIVTLPSETLGVGQFDLDIEISQIDGQPDYYNLDNVGSGSFSLLGDDTPVVTNTLANPAAACAGSQGLLSATSPQPGRIPAWYDDPAGTTLLYVGETFLTAPVNGNKTYYVGTVGNEYVGMEDKDAGTSFPSFNVDSYLEFEVYSEIVLKSVLIDVSSIESRNIQIRDLNGSIIGSKPTGTLSLGANRIQMGFELAPGTYRMGLGTNSTAGLSSTISNINFPYEVPGIMSITESDNGFYNYFYDWEVEYKGACDLQPAYVIQAPGTALALFTADKQVVDLSVSGEVNFTNNSAGASTYVWDFGDGTTSTDANPSHSYTLAGTYLVTLNATSSGGCSDADSLSIVVDGILGLDDLDEELGNIDVYPNPGSGAFTLEVNLTQSRNIQVEVLNLVGQQVWNQDSRPMTRETQPIDLTQLPDGVYMLRLSVDGRVLTEKLVKTQ